ncbi:replicative DNA helicase [Aeromonas sp. 23P]|uniref:replicative DNA helicase n=1 Tax=Aeromonas sp. 23P TaxID=3452716 RepID=UPI003F79AED3
MSEIESDSLGDSSKNVKDAEFKVLVGLIRSKDLLDSYIDVIKPTEFLLPKHKKIFGIIKKSSQDGFALNRNFVLSLFIEKEIFDDEDDADYAVKNIFEMHYDISEFSSFLYVARMAYVRRTLKIIGHEMTGEESDSDRIDKIISSSADALADLQIIKNQRQNTVANGRDLMLRCMGSIQTKMQSSDGSDLLGMPTGIYELDSLYGGFKKSDLIVIAARPAMGKTSLAMGMVAYWVLTGKKGIVFSLEMPKEQLMFRLFSVICEIVLKDVMTGRMTDAELSRLETLATSAAQILEENLIVDDKPSVKPSYIRRVAAQHSVGKPLDFIIVDYLQLMRSDTNFGGSRTNEVSECSMTSKGIAKELNTVFIQLSQLNRDLEKRADKRPTNSDLRESGAIEQDADGIIFIYRDVVYDNDTPNPREAELIIGKNRSGPLGTAYIDFDGIYTKFSSRSNPVDYMSLVKDCEQRMNKFNELRVA